MDGNPAPPTPPVIERVTDRPAALGESPVWHPVAQVLYYCDIPGRAVRCWNPATGVERQWSIDSEVGSLAPIADSDDLLLACRDGLWRFEPTTGRRHRLAPPPYDPAHERFNDGKCDPRGRFWVGTLHEARQPLAALHCFDGHQLLLKASGITTSNGLAWSPDQRTLYWSDTRAHTIYTLDFDVETGSLGSARRVFARFLTPGEAGAGSRYGGRPDGAAVDAAGRYWVAMFEGARLLCFAPDGAVVHDIALPVQCPTMPCFGDADLRTLYLTTARDKRPADELAQQPWAGCVLRLRVGIPGLPAHGFQPLP